MIALGEGSCPSQLLAFSPSLAIHRMPHCEPLAGIPSRGFWEFLAAGRLTARLTATHVYFLPMLIENFDLTGIDGYSLRHLGHHLCVAGRGWGTA
jgi:hypothetical protein